MWIAIVVTMVLIPITCEACLEGVWIWMEDGGVSSMTLRDGGIVYSGLGYAGTWSVEGDRIFVVRSEYIEGGQFVGIVSDDGKMITSEGITLQKVSGIDERCP